MKIQATNLDKAVLIKLSGRMDAENAVKFQQACDAWIAQGATRLIVDLAELEYVSSMGLGCFLAVAKALQAKAGAMILCDLHGLPKQVFQLMDLLSMFTVCDNTAAALAFAHTADRETEL